MIATDRAMQAIRNSRSTRFAKHASAPSLCELLPPELRGRPVSELIEVAVAVA